MSFVYAVSMAKQRDIVGPDILAAINVYEFQLQTNLINSLLF